MNAASRRTEEALNCSFGCLFVGLLLNSELSLDETEVCDDGKVQRRRYRMELRHIIRRSQL